MENSPQTDAILWVRLNRVFAPVSLQLRVYRASFCRNLGRRHHSPFTEPVEDSLRVVSTCQSVWPILDALYRKKELDAVLLEAFLERFYIDDLLL